MTLLFVALDFDSSARAVEMAGALDHVVDGFKVGLQLLLGPGPATVEAITRLGKPVFVDAKLHDIPHTVERAAFQLGRIGARFVSAHAAGGESMLRAAVAGLGEGAAGNEAGVLAITVLTSLNQEAMIATGIIGGLDQQVARLARLAKKAGAEGVVCSARQLAVAGEAAPGLLRVTPGIRDIDQPSDDQLHTAPPAAAAEAGADIIVVGRPITRAIDPIAAATRFLRKSGTVYRAGFTQE